jgi:hypothetical protein
VKGRPDQKVEKALDQALADTFPASDPIALLQPTSAGRGPKTPYERKEAVVLKPAGKEAFRRASGF